jgi:glycolate oxidase iron-sulfur subunit
VTLIDRELVSTCVHCGFCLPTCPTWGLWREEMDSPRGRVYLMEGLADGTLRLNPTVVEHFDRCLGCMACVTSCPSGVLYDRLIEQTRATIEREYRRPRRERALRAAVLAVVPHPRRLRKALRLAPAGRRLPLPSFLRPLAELAPPWRSGVDPPERTEPVGEQTARVGLLTGCVQRVIFGDVNVATVRVLAAHGFEVTVPRAQACCGALAVHAGERDQGLRQARRTIDAFEQARVDLVVSNAAGCGSNLKDYAHLLADDPAYAERAALFSTRVRDVSELLAGLAPRLEQKPLQLRVALQDSCHLVHAQGVHVEQRALLGRIPGLSLAEPEDQALCCGSAGIYNLVQPDAALELGRRKAERVLAVEPDAYTAANPGCLVQVTAALRRAGRPLPAFHPVELVDASLSGVDADELLRRARR